jgi:membrane protein DedA with SNARE-associated domain
MPLADLVAQYGYAAVFVGSILEGETILLLAGAAAQKGYLSFAGVAALAFCGGTLGDQILFAIGRRHGVALLRRYPRLAARAEPVQQAIRRHQDLLIIGVRFMYGVRLIGPFVIGMSEVSARRFLPLNLLGAAVWAPLVVGVGYAFGHTLDWLLTGIARFEAVGLVVLALVAAGIGLRQWLHRKDKGSPP